MKRILKQWLLPSGRKTRRLLGGLSRGMVMQLDLQHQMQRLIGLDEREIMPAVRQRIRECASLVDVGANDGFYTMAFLRSPARRVIACEPSDAAERLLANATANGFSPDGRFTLIRRFIGCGPDAIPLRDLVRDLPAPVFLKVDIDGGEVDLLRSIEGSERFRDLRWLVETHSADLERQCCEWFAAHRYQTEIVPNASWRWLIPELRPVEQNRWLIAEPRHT